MANHTRIRSKLKTAQKVNIIRLQIFTFLSNYTRLYTIMECNNIISSIFTYIPPPPPPLSAKNAMSKVKTELCVIFNVASP
jgi:hypothetical protein